MKKVFFALSFIFGLLLLSTASYAQSVTISKTDVSCKNGSNGAATANVSGGTSPYTYLWSVANLSTQSISGLVAGTYSVLVTDQTSATATATVQITEPNALAISLTKTDGCNGANNGTATANVTGGTAPYIYTWSAGNQTTQTATGLSSSSHIVSVTDSKGCAANATVTITQPPALDVTVSKTDVTCNGTNNGTATANPSGGTTPYAYLWTWGQATKTATGLSAISYTVTVTDANGCTKNAGVSITQPSSPLSISISSSNGCNGSTGTATANAGGGTVGYSYTWSNGQITKTATGLTTGTYTVTAKDANNCTVVGIASITQSTAITLTVSSTNASCNGANNGTATVSAAGGTTPYIYLWTGGQTVATATGLAPGNYTITVTDANGCTKTASATVSQPSTLAIATTKTDVTCNGLSNGTATVNTTGGNTPYTYLWTGGQITQTATGLSTGNFSIIVTDAKGCSQSAIVTISQPTVLTVGVTKTNDCGVLGTATANPSGGTGPYTFSWNTSPVQTTATATGLASGTYIATVIDAKGCSANNSVAIVQSNPITLTVTQTNSACNGGTGTATANATGGTGSFNYLWNPTGQTNPTATNLSSGNYTVTVTDGNSCTKSATITITQPQILTLTVTPTNISCAGANNGTATANINGGTAPYIFAWSNSQATQSIANLGVGSYTVTVTDANGCSKSGSVNITQPNALLTTTSQTNICDGGTGTATINPTGGTPQYTYSWTTSPVQTTKTATGLVAGNYTVTVKDANGCSTFNAVAIVKYATINLTASSTNISCNNGKGTATANASGGTGTLSYLWTPGGQTSPSVSNLLAGNYTVTVTDANGCSKSASVSITEPPAMTLTIVKSNIVCNGGKGSATANVTGGSPAYAYVWNTTPAQSAQIATGLDAGNYQVTVTDASGCTKSASISITQPPVLVTSVTPSHIYDGTTGSATVSASGGVPSYSYSWSTTPYQSTTTATGLTAGTYSVSVTDEAGCVNIKMVTILASKIQYLSAGFDHSLSMCQNSVTAWGDNMYSQIGDGTSSDKDTAVIIPGLTNINVIEGGRYHTMALKKDGNMLVWGRNNEGQLGTGNVTNHNTPYALNSISKVINIAAGSRHTLALKSNGIVMAWGGNASGQVGDGSYNQRNSPTEAYNLFRVTDIACGSDHSLAIDQDSIVWAWGSNTNGQLGDGTSQNRGTPVKAKKLSSVIAIEGGGGHSLAIKKDGTVWAWGLNDEGQLGDGTTTNRDTAVKVQGLTGIIAISAGDRHSLALKNDGTVWAWGSNYSGELGNNSNTGSKTPVQVSGLTGVTHIKAGYSHSLAVKGNGQVWAWGANSEGQLGDNTNSSKKVPVMTDMPCVVQTLVATTKQTNIVCNGNTNGSATVFATGGTQPYSYTWNPGGQNTATISGLTAGSYTAIVTDVNGFKDTAVVSIYQPAALSGSVSTTAITCYGGNNGTATANISGGTPAYKYFWNTVPSQTTAKATGLTLGNYMVYITDANSCTANMSVSISQPSSALTISIGGVINATSCTNSDGSIITFASGGTPNYNFAWSTAPVQTTATAVALAAGSYTLTVTDATNCVAKVSATVACPTGVDTYSQEAVEVTVYPNPSFGKYQIAASNYAEIVSVEVYSLIGKQVYAITHSATKQINEIDISHQPAGVYFLRITTNNGATDRQGVKKIVKE